MYNFQAKLLGSLAFCVLNCILNTTESMYFYNFKTKAVNEEKKTEKYDSFQ